MYRNGVQIATVATTSYLDRAPVVGGNTYTLVANNTGGISSSSSIPVNAIWYPAPSTIAPAQMPVVLPLPVTPNTATTEQPSIAGFLTASLSYGSRDSQVKILQSILVAHGYLAANLTTGFFGNLTLQAVQKFQCDHAIACSGAAGWGIVGPKTRTALNALAGSGAEISPSASSTASLNAEIQALQQKLQALEAQLK